MTLNIVTTGNTILAADINQLVNVLQRSGGQTEPGKYWIGGWGNIASDIMSQFMPSMSRNTALVSITTDTTDQAPSNCNALSNDHQTANGVHLYTSTTGAATSANIGGNLTFNY